MQRKPIVGTHMERAGFLPVIGMGDTTHSPIQQSDPAAQILAVLRISAPQVEMTGNERAHKETQKNGRTASTVRPFAAFAENSRKTAIANSGKTEVQYLIASQNALITRS